MSETALEREVGGWAAGPGLCGFDVCPLDPFLTDLATRMFTGTVVQSFCPDEAGLGLIFHLYCMAQGQACSGAPHMSAPFSFCFTFVGVEVLC